jgi:hypothetical protein
MQDPKVMSCKNNLYIPLAWRDKFTIYSIIGSSFQMKNFDTSLSKGIDEVF